MYNRKIGRLVERPTMDRIASIGADAALFLDCVNRGLREDATLRTLKTESSDLSELIHDLAKRLRGELWSPTEVLVFARALKRTWKCFRFTTVIGLRTALEKIGPRFARVINGTASQKEIK